jgi:hypothetical protein
MRGDASSSWRVGRSCVNFSLTSNFGDEPGSTGLNDSKAVECMGMGHDIRVLNRSESAIEILSERTVGLRVCMVVPDIVVGYDFVVEYDFVVDWPLRGLVPGRLR